MVAAVIIATYSKHIMLSLYRKRQHAPETASSTWLWSIIYRIPEALNPVHWNYNSSWTRFSRCSTATGSGTFLPNCSRAVPRSEFTFATIYWLELPCFSVNPATSNSSTKSLPSSLPLLLLCFLVAKPNPSLKKNASLKARYMLQMWVVQ